MVTLSSLTRLVALAALLCISPAALAKDDLCRELDRYASSQLTEKSAPAPRHWVEMHYGFHDDAFTLWSMACLHSDDIGSAGLCQWLRANTGGEFADANLQRRVIACMGYRFPQRARGRWGVSEGYFQQKIREGVWLTMEITKAGLPGTERAIRLSFERDDDAFSPPGLGPVKSIADKAGASSNDR